MTLKELLDVVDVWKNGYVSDTGLTNLDSWDELATMNRLESPTDRRAHSDNGILFTDIFFGLLDAYGGSQIVNSMRSVAAGAVRSLERYPGTRAGYYKRAPHDNRAEAHDNYAAIISLSKRFGFSDHIAINNEGRKTGYCFNNLNPGVFDIRYQRQGGEIAFYQMAAGEKPDPLNLIWWWGGLLWSAVGSRKPDSLMLTWRRRKALGIEATVPVWAVQNYFKPNHPCRLIVDNFKVPK